MIKISTKARRSLKIYIKIKQMEYIKANYLISILVACLRVKNTACLQTDKNFTAELRNEQTFAFKRLSTQYRLMNRRKPAVELNIHKVKINTRMETGSTRGAHRIKIEIRPESTGMEIGNGRC